MKIIKTLLLFSCLVLLSGCRNSPPDPAQLAQEILIIDTHIDVPYRLSRFPEDITTRTSRGDFDLVRAREGGLNCAFFSIYVPAELEITGKAFSLADSLISMVDSLVKANPDQMAFAFSPADVLQNVKKGLFSVALGMENGSPIEGKLQNLSYFRQRGIRYITLAHSRNNHICDSSYDTERKWNGLSPFGEEVVKEMNRLGIMIDVSHVSDSAFYDILKISTVPVIASHSSCRHFTPGWERNMSDEMITALASHGGVIQINFGTSFLRGDFDQKMREAYRQMREHHYRWDSKEGQEFLKQYMKEHGIQLATVKDVADHIDHVVQLVGINHVGLGSDFDGLGETLPTDLKDVSMLPNLIAELLTRGYTREEIEKICGLNLLRVWQAVEDGKNQFVRNPEGN